MKRDVKNQFNGGTLLTTASIYTLQQIRAASASTIMNFFAEDQSVLFFCHFGGSHKYVDQLI